MLNFIEVVLAILIIIIIVPQTPTENIVLRKIFETGLFPNYSAAKQFLIRFTWFLIGVFLFLLFILNIKI